MCLGAEHPHIEELIMGLLILFFNFRSILKHSRTLFKNMEDFLRTSDVFKNYYMKLLKGPLHLDMGGPLHLLLPLPDVTQSPFYQGGPPSYVGNLHPNRCK